MRGKNGIWKRKEKWGWRNEMRENYVNENGKYMVKIKEEKKKN